MARRTTRRARRQHGQGKQPHSLIQFFEQHFAPAKLEGRGYALKQHFRQAARHLADLIGRPPVVADLTTDTLNSLIDRLFAEGYAQGTVLTHRKVLMALARDAHRANLLERVPSPRPLSNPPAESATPLSAEELSRLLLAARTIPDAPADNDHQSDREQACSRLHAGCDKSPARLWWPAFLFALLETRASLPELFAASPAAFSPPDTLAVGTFVYRLHPLAASALSALRDVDPRRERLFPWTLDNGRPPYTMLYRAYRTLLYRAKLPDVKRNAFNALCQTAKETPDILDGIDLSVVFQPAAGQPILPRTSRVSRANPQRPVDAAQPGTVARSLCRFFQDVYLPKRLAGKSPSTAEGYENSLRRLGEMLERPPTLDDLSDDTLEDLIVWGVTTRKVANVTANGYARHILALWRFAYRKRLVDELPRDVEFLREYKANPECWSQEQLARLLRSCSAEPGRITGIPARLFWSALVLVIYDTGIRIGALLSLRSADLDVETGWLRVPADVQKDKEAQTFRLHQETLALLRETDPAGRTLLFPWPWHSLSKSFYPRIDAILKRAGLPHGKRDKFHKIRRTHATFYADVAGEDAAQKQLGHSSIQVTRNYIDISKLTGREQPADVIARPDWRNVG